MSLHDGYARMTPFEIAFPDRERIHALAAAAATEAAQRKADATVPDGFLGLTAVGAFLRELLESHGPPGSLPEYGALVFHAVHFAGAGCPLFLLETATSRHLVGAPPASEPAPPSRAGYLQLPQHLFWASGAGGAPESLDGMFWSVSDRGTLHVLPIAGLRPDRSGFSAFPLPDAPIAHAGRWVHATVREHDADYASALPGADLDGLYSIEAAGELLKLLARFFAYAAASPTALERVDRSQGVPDGPRPSALPYTRVKLVA